MQAALYSEGGLLCWISSGNIKSDHLQKSVGGKPTREVCEAQLAKVRERKLAGLKPGEAAARSAFARPKFESGLSAGTRFPQTNSKFKGKRATRLSFPIQNSKFPFTLIVIQRSEAKRSDEGISFPLSGTAVLVADFVARPVCGNEIATSRPVAAPRNDAVECNGQSAEIGKS